MNENINENISNNINDFYKVDPPKSKKKRWLKGLIIVLVILVVLFSLGSFLSYKVKSALSSPAEFFPSESFVALLKVDGVISGDNTDNFGRPLGYQHRFTINKIDELIADPFNEALIFYINTPGGGVYESDELYFKIKEYQEKTDRPVISYMSSMAASGGYYISAPTDMIIANRNCWTGSIGVTVGTFYDVSDFLANHGIKTTTIDSGANKSMGNITDVMRPDQRDILQSLVDDSYEQFINIVAEGRGISLDKVKTLADGRIYTAQQALDLDLIDMIANYDDALQIIGEKFDLFGLPVHEIRYQDDSFFGKLFEKLPLPNGPRSETEAILSLVKNNMAFPISYTCPILMD